VDKVEALFSFLDAGTESLRKVQAQLKRYRQAVLKYAFEGKLTEEWRKTHKNQIEPAQTVLKNVKEKPKESLMFGESLPNLPSEWMWVKLGDLTDLTSGKAFKADEYSEKGISLLQIANVSFGKIIWENKVYLPKSYLEKYPNIVLRTEDILLALNRPILDGMLKVGQLHDQDAPAILYQRVGRFDFYFPFLKLYLFNYYQSPLFVDCLKRSLQGVDQPFVNKPRLLEIPVPIAPLKEQEIILEYIQHDFSLCDKVEQIAKQSLSQSEHLHQSILKTAFEGKLVPQNPHDEPAEKLLGRKKSELAGNNKNRMGNQLELSNYVK
jgi:type I restriction enzyme, S subunit